MAKMANIVVKKADGTTNFTFTALSASPGDGEFAVWRGEGASPALAANLRTKSLWNGKKDRRRTEVSGNYPKVVNQAGVDVVMDFGSFSFSATVPLTFTATEAADFAAVAANAVADALMRATVASGYGPTN